MKNKGFISIIIVFFMLAFLFFGYTVYIAYSRSMQILDYDNNIPYSNLEYSKLSCDQLKETLEYEEQNGISEEKIPTILGVMQLKGCRL